MANLFDPQKNKSLSRQEEVELFRQHDHPDASPAEKQRIRDKIITSNTGFVLKTAKYYAHKSPTFYEDFISAGFEGLLLAFDKFDRTKGYRFLSYAGFWVRERVLRTMSTFRIVTVPVVNQQVQAKIDRLRAAGLREPQVLAMFRPEQHRLVTRMMENSYRTFSMDEMLENTGDESEEDLVELDLVRGEVGDAMARLSEKHRKVLEAFLHEEDVNEEVLQDALVHLREKLLVDEPGLLD